MMRCEMRSAGIIVFICMAMLSPAKAQDNIQEMLMKCTTTPDSGDQWYCYGRVTGIFEMMKLNGETVARFNSAAKSLLSVCGVKPPPSYGAQVQVFTNWAKRHPEKWRLPDGEGILLAMRETWPCR